VQVAVTPVATTAERVEQHVVFLDAAQKRSALAALLRRDGFARTLVFTRTKHGADRVVRHLAAAGIDAAAIHGNKSQSQRERALAGFKSGQAPTLVATDIAARGIDVDGVTHVINFDLPNISESYVHRIGRTARAGAAGVAISLCAPEEREFLRDIEKLIRQKVPELRLSADDMPAAPAPERPQATRPQQHKPRAQQGHRNAHHKAQHHKGAHRHGGGHDERGHGKPAPHPERAARPQPRPAANNTGHGPSEIAGLSFMRPSRPQHDQRRHGNGERRAHGR